MATVETVKIDADVQGAISGFQRLQTAGMSTLQNLKGTGDKLTKVGQNLAMVTAPIAVGFAAVGKVASDFEDSMNRLKAVSNATEAEFAKLKDQAMELGRTTRYSAKQAGDAQSFLAMAGFEVNEVMSAMPGLLDLATAGQLDLARAADISSNILTGYGFEATQINYINDVMAKTSTSANTNISQLGEAMKYAAPIAKSAGIEFTEAAAIIGKLSDAGIQGSMAWTSLRGAISRLLKPTKDTIETLSQLGVSVQDSSGNMRSMTEIIQDLESAGANTADMLTIFGQEAGTGMAALLGQGSASLQELKDKLDASEGSAKKMAETMGGGLSGQVAGMQAAMEGLAIAIAETGFLDMMSIGINLLTGVVQAIANLPKPVLAAITALAALAVVTTTLLIGIGTMITVFTTVSTTIPVVTAAIGGLKLTALPMAGIFAGISAPVLLTLAAFVALGAGIGILIANWNNLPAPVHKATSAISFATKIIGQSFLELPKNIAQLPSALGAYLGIATAGFVRFKTEMKYQLATVTSAIANWGSGLWRAGWGAINNFFKGIGSGFDQGVDWFKGQLTRLRNLLPGSEPKDTSSPLAALGNAGTATMTNFAAGLTANPAMQSLKSGLNTVKESLTVEGGLGVAGGGNAPTPVGNTAGGGVTIVYSPNNTIEIRIDGSSSQGDDFLEKLKTTLIQALEERDREFLDFVDRASARWRQV